MNNSLIPITTLYVKEVKRFIKVGMQTIIGPAISSLLFLAVFSLALGRSVEFIENIPFSNFIAPGLIMMTILQNAFSNSASSIGQAKFQGNIVFISNPAPFRVTFGARTKTRSAAVLAGLGRSRRDPQNEENSKKTLCF